MSALSFIEKRVVCEIAREAYDVWPGRPAFERSVSAGANPFDAWRHREQAVAVGLRSLAHCRQEHYATLKEHFQKIRQAGEAHRMRLERREAIGQQTLFSP